MADYESLLFPVFNELRTQGVPLGVEEYLLAARTFREGVGVESPETFRQLCCLLWTKSLEDQELFDVAFTKWVEPQLQTILENTTSSSVTPPPSTGPSATAPPAMDGQKPASGSKKEPEMREVPVAFRSLPLDRGLPTKASPLHLTDAYLLTPRLPIDRREITGLWRHLRRLQREGTPEELDVEGTINNFCRIGFFLRPVLQPRRRNQARLVLLIDQQGSMEPFSLLIDALVESVMRGGLLGKVTLHYFHDCPEYILFERPSLTITRPLEEVLSEQAKGNSVLIVSDAGAARGNYDGKRLANTRAFLKTLDGYTYLYTWLNPMPVKRWAASTAEDIACTVPMFPLDREGLNDAINILRGHPFPPGVNLNA